VEGDLPFGRIWFLPFRVLQVPATRPKGKSPGTDYAKFLITNIRMTMQMLVINNDDVVITKWMCSFGQRSALLEIRLKYYSCQAVNIRKYQEISGKRR
jgi:hypothetical protein